MARKEKGGENWYIGCTANENGHTSVLNFDFLDSGKQYETIIYRDDVDAHYLENPQAYIISSQKITSKSRIKISAAPGGGYAMSIKLIE